jgi:hypothetical protein
MHLFIIDIAAAALDERIRRVRSLFLVFIISPFKNNLPGKY